MLVTSAMHTPVPH